MRLAKPHLHPKRDMHDISGIEIPDSKLVRKITELVRDTEPLLLFTIRAAFTISVGRTIGRFSSD